MKASITVENRAEADRIKVALDDPVTRAFVNVMGSLLPLEPRYRTSVLNFTAEHFTLQTRGEPDGQ